jgi:hypothetical protein
VETKIPSLDNEWRSSAKALAEERHWDYWAAYDYIVIDYLQKAGNAYPLCDLILNLRRNPSRRAATYIGAMLDSRLTVKFPAPQFPYYFDVDLNRRRGRPSKQPVARKESWQAQLAFGALLEGIDCFINGDEAPRRFWVVLARALEADEYERVERVRFPLKIETRRVDGNGSDGRRHDPTLARRDIMLAAAVASKIQSDCNYDQATREVGQAFGIGERTVCTAYDKHFPKRSRPQ